MDSPGSPPRQHALKVKAGKMDSPGSPRRQHALKVKALSKARRDAAPDEPLYVPSTLAGDTRTTRELAAGWLMQYWRIWGGPPALPPHLELRGFGQGSHTPLDPYNRLSAQEWVTAYATRRYWKQLTHKVAREERLQLARAKEVRLQLARADSGPTGSAADTEDYDTEEEERLRLARADSGPTGGAADTEEEARLQLARADSVNAAVDYDTSDVDRADSGNAAVDYDTSDVDRADSGNPAVEYPAHGGGSSSGRANDV
jgi:hypothetical protein